MAKDDIIPKLTTVFQRYGYDGTTLKQLSDMTGLGKASLYHHFPNGKEEMAAAVLSDVGKRFDDLILAPLRTTAPPLKRLQSMSRNISEFYAHGEKSCLLAVMSLGDSGDRFQAGLQQAMKAWINTLSAVLREAGINGAIAQQRAEDAVIQVQGALVVARVLGDTQAFQRVITELPEKLLAPSQH
jgi:AcrR family transcriptional regulator